MYILATIFARFICKKNESPNVIFFLVSSQKSLRIGNGGSITLHVIFRKVLLEK